MVKSPAGGVRGSLFPVAESCAPSASGGGSKWGGRDPLCTAVLLCPKLSTGCDTKIFTFDPRQPRRRI